jgi:hypothetical protein
LGHAGRVCDFFGRREQIGLIKTPERLMKNQLNLFI